MRNRLISRLAADLTQLPAYPAYFLRKVGDLYALRSWISRSVVELKTSSSECKCLRPSIGLSISKVLNPELEDTD